MPTPKRVANQHRRAKTASQHIVPLRNMAISVAMAAVYCLGALLTWQTMPNSALSWPWAPLHLLIATATRKLPQSLEIFIVYAVVILAAGPISSLNFWLFFKTRNGPGRDGATKRHKTSIK